MTRFRSALRRALRAFTVTPPAPSLPSLPSGSGGARRPPDVPEWLQNKLLRKFAQRYADILDTRRGLGATGAPILLGPWMSEVGHELLYWVPMLRFLQRELRWDPGRAVVVTRGGAAAWYEGLAGRACDILDLMSVDQFRALNEQRWKAQHGAQKQKRITDVDRQVMDMAARRLGISEYEPLHPKLMYRSLNLYWNGVLGLNWYDSLTQFAPLTPPDVPASLALPEGYAAVKFYFRPSFPDTPANRRFVGDFIRHLARSRPVVIVESGRQYDDHAEYRPAERSADVVRLDLSGDPAGNLAAQTAVIARAEAFYGTYGGFTYLPMHFNVPATGFVDEPGQVLPLHLTAAQRACAIFTAAHQHERARINVLTTADARELLDLPHVS